MTNGLFVIAELEGEAGRVIREIQSEFDRRLAGTGRVPHVTIAGSSGLGPIPAATTVEELHRALRPVADSTPQLTLPFGRPEQFMQTNIIVLPLDPHGPLRELHDRIGRSGLQFERPRFTFTPHATLSLYPTLSRAQLRRILSLRVELPAKLTSISIYHTMDPQPARKLLELELRAP